MFIIPLTSKARSPSPARQNRLQQKKKMGWYRLYLHTKFLNYEKNIQFCLYLLYSILSRQFVQHADAEINAPQIAPALCEMQLISAVILSTFMSIHFFELVKGNI